MRDVSIYYQQADRAGRVVKVRIGEYGWWGCQGKGTHGYSSRPRPMVPTNFEMVIVGRDIIATESISESSA